MTGDLISTKTQYKKVDLHAACAIAIYLSFTRLLRLLCWQKACHIRATDWTGTLDHAGAFGRNFDLAVLDRPLGAAFNAIAFEFHFTVSFGKKFWRACRYPRLSYIILV